MTSRPPFPLAQKYLGGGPGEAELPPPDRPGNAGAKPVLQIDGLTLSIHGQTLLKQINLQIDTGEILAIVGESGSGKSMSALAIMGLLPHGTKTKGIIRFANNNLLTLNEKQLCAIRGRQIGMIFQEPMSALNPLHSIGAQITEAIRLHNGTSKAQELLHKVGLDLPLSRYPHELSGGQRQRVMIAMAIACRPCLLIADEPTTALDVTTQAQILTLLKTLAKQENMALLMITHDLAVVSDMADQIAVMQQGEIVETASALHHLRHPYSHALLQASRHRPDLPATKAQTPLLRVQNVTRIYPAKRFARNPRFTALRDVSFTLHKGERLGLVGESGCGKSTLTRAILGLDPIEGGQITLDDVPVGTPHTRRQMQMVFQDPYGSFNPRHRVSRLLSEPFHLLPDPPRGKEREAAIIEALRTVGLSPEDRHRHIHAFSGGQRQRLAIARALIIRPGVIVFDEAVSALDVRVRARILDLLADLARSHHLTWLFITHDLSVLRGITDRVLVMQKGRIVEDGPTSAVLSAPRHPYTAQLLKAAPQLPEGLDYIPSTQNMDERFSD